MICAAAAVVLTLITQAGPHPVAGAWRIAYPWHIDVKDGVVTPVMETGQLTVEARADSIIAILLKDAGSSGRPTLRLAAPRSSADTLVFVTRDKVSLTTSGATRETTAVNRWVFTAKGDELSGSMERRVEGAPSVGPQKLRGTRIKS